MKHLAKRQGIMHKIKGTCHFTLRIVSLDEQKEMKLSLHLHALQKYENVLKVKIARRDREKEVYQQLKKYT